MPLIQPSENFEKGITGFYENIDFGRYGALKAVNASAIKAMFPQGNWIIPAYARWHFDNPKEDTDSLSLGRSAHLALFQPEEFEKLTIKPKFEGKTKDGKEAKNPSATAEAKEKEAAWLKENEGKEIIEQEEYDAAKAIVEQCRACPKVNSLLEKNSYNELSGLWTDPATGLLCKIRIDRFITIDKKPAILDAKTTSVKYGALPDIFKRSIYEYKYHLQKAFYCQGVKEIMGLKELPDSIIIVIETKGAKLVNAQYLHEAWLVEGGKLINRAMGIFKGCIESGNWYGYPDKILPNAPSAWMFSNEE